MSFDKKKDIEDSAYRYTHKIGTQVMEHDEIQAPKVSVIIPAYNVARYIAEALDSVLSQTYKNYEIIVINDGSPDTEELERLLEPYQKSIVYLKQENLGAGAARNTGIYVARGELIAFLDADDLWLPEFLESQTAFLEKNELDMVWADAYLFGESSLGGPTFMQASPSKGEVTLESLLDQKCNVITSGTVARKDAILDVDGFDKNIFRGHDYDLWVRMVSNNARLGYQKQVLLKHRLRSDSLSGNSIQRVERERNVYSQILKKVNLEDKHKQIIDRHLNRLQARKKIIHGKFYFINGDFKAAAENLHDANLYFQSVKLKLIILMLNLAPRFFLYIYKFIRRHEVASIKNATLKQ